jgi:hypothetical protein
MTENDRLHQQRPSVEAEKGHGEQTRPMRVEVLLFSAWILFFIPVAIIYMWLSDAEPVGTVGLFLLGGMFAFSGGYLWLTARRIDQRPEDDPRGEIEDRAGEVGTFSPHSWAPLVIGIGTMLAFLGLAFGWWLTGIGAVVALVGLAGQLTEFSRGQHKH